MAKKRERLEDTTEFMKKYGQTLKRMDERNKTAEEKKAKLNKQDLKKLPGFAENYEESLIRQLFEEDLKRKIEKYLAFLIFLASLLIGQTGIARSL